MRAGSNFFGTAWQICLAITFIIHSSYQRHESYIDDASVSVPSIAGLQSLFLCYYWVNNGVIICHL